MDKRKLLHFLLTAVCITLFTFPAGAEKVLPAAKWQRFELTLKSSVTYTNPLQEAEMRVLFISPLGETNRVYGFWDGGKTWRVRFQPGFAGRWTYYTMCSDTANKGLHGQAGSFLCTATKGESSFDLHGPIQVARSQKHLEHADRTPFLWLGDAAWSAGIKSARNDWEEFIETRAKQKFNVVQWRLNPENLVEQEAAFSGRDRVSVKPEIFRQLDAKVTAANRAGLLCAIAPLWEISDGSENQLPEDQAIRLLRYVVARWSAEDVAWIVAFESDSTGAQANRWQNIGRAVFGQVTHAPVILLPGESVWAFDAFRRERWVDVLGVQTTSAINEDSLPWLLHGPLAMERQKQPAHPLVTISPPPEVSAKPTKTQITAELAGRLPWWSLLLNTPAGVSYQAQDVSAWIIDPKSPKAPQPWREALKLSGAEVIAPMAAILGEKEFWRLEARPSAAMNNTNMSQESVTVATEGNEFAVTYTPSQQILNANSLANSGSVLANWHNLRTGDHSLANVSNQRFTPPAPGDWLLSLQKTAPRTVVAEAKKPSLKIDKRGRD